MVIRLQLLESSAHSLSVVEEYVPNEKAQKLFKKFVDELKKESGNRRKSKR